jgi:hypothetical protein
MRTYIGSIDSDTGTASVAIAEAGDRPNLTQIGYLLDRLDDIAERRRADPNFRDPARAQMLLDQEHATVQRLKAAEIRTRPLPHQPIHSPDGFGWGYPGSGPADLANAILHNELGDTVPPAVYLPFRNDVIATLDPDGFELPATAVWDWVRHNRHLLDDHLFTPDPPGASVPTMAPAPAGPGR